MHTTIKTESIPQANNLGRVILAVQAVADGKGDCAEIAAELGCVERQGRYYRAAAESMRLIREVGPDEFVVTGLGKRLLAANADPARQQRVLKEAMLKNPAMRAVHEQISGRGQTPERLVRWLCASSGLNAVTAQRRLESVVNWLRYAGLAYVKEDGRLKAMPV